MDNTNENIEKILKYYLLTNKLKSTIRSGWKKWNVKTSRLESVAEHVFGTCMLAISIWSQTLPQVNLAEVLMTLAIHETEEIIIGDLTPFDKGYSTKKIEGEKAVKEIFKGMLAEEVFTTLIKNFDNKSTPEAVFAYKCDKLECDLQAKIYDEAGVMKFADATPEIKNSEKIKVLEQKGVKNPSTFFVMYDRPIFASKDAKVNDIFLEISKYIEKNKISTLLGSKK